MSAVTDPPIQDSPSNAHRVVALLLLFGLGAVGSTLFAFAARRQLVDDPPDWPGIAGAGLLGVSGLFVGLQFVAAQRHRIATALGLAVGAGLLGALGGFGTYVQANVWLDDAPTRTVRATVVGRVVREESRGKSEVDIRYLKLDHDLATGRPGDDEVQVPRALYERVADGMVVDVDLGQGRFGVRYVVAVQVE
jgi:hypothetical protein